MQSRKRTRQRSPAEATFTVVSSAGNTYADWASPYFSPTEMATIGAFTADADGDGIPNGIESAMGTHPRQASSRATITTDMGTNGSLLHLRFQRAEPLPSDVTLTVRTSPDLGSDNWTLLTQKTGSGAWSTPAAVVEGTAAGGIVPVAVHALSAGPSHLFMRLEVSQAPPP